MIKVNLLKEQMAHKPKKVSTTTPAVSRTTIIYVSVVVIVAVGMGIYWDNLNKRIKNSESIQADLRQEEERLKSMRQELENLEALRIWKH